MWFVQLKPPCLFGGQGLSTGSPSMHDLSDRCDAEFLLLSGMRDSDIILSGDVEGDDYQDLFFVMGPLR